MARLALVSVFPPLELVVCFSALGHRLHVFPRLASTAGDFPRLEPVASFPALGSGYVIRPYYYKMMPLVVALHVSIYYKRVLKCDENRIKTFSLPPVPPETRQHLPQICYDLLS